MTEYDLRPATETTAGCGHPVYVVVGEQIPLLCKGCMEGWCQCDHATFVHFKKTGECGMDGCPCQKYTHVSPSP